MWHIRIIVNFTTVVSHARLLSSAVIRQITWFNFLVLLFLVVRIVSDRRPAPQWTSLSILTGNVLEILRTALILGLIVVVIVRADWRFVSQGTGSGVGSLGLELRWRHDGALGLLSVGQGGLVAAVGGQAGGLVEDWHFLGFAVPGV